MYVERKRIAFDMKNMSVDIMTKMQSDNSDVAVEDIYIPQLTNTLKSALRKSRCDAYALKTLSELFESAQGTMYSEPFLRSGGLHALRDVLELNPYDQMSCIVTALRLILGFSKISHDNKIEICDAGIISSLVLLCRRSTFDAFYFLAAAILSELARVERPFFLTAGIAIDDSDRCHSVPEALTTLMNSPRTAVKRVALRLGLDVWTDPLAVHIMIRHEHGVWIKKLFPQLCRILLSKQEAIECKYEAAEWVQQLCQHDDIRDVFLHAIGSMVILPVTIGGDSIILSNKWALRSSSLERARATTGSRNREGMAQREMHSSHRGNGTADNVEEADNNGYDDVNGNPLTICSYMMNNFFASASQKGAISIPQEPIPPLIIPQDPIPMTSSSSPSYVNATQLVGTATEAQTPSGLDRLQPSQRFTATRWSLFLQKEEADLDASAISSGHKQRTAQASMPAPTTAAVDVKGSNGEKLFPSNQLDDTSSQPDNSRRVNKFNTTYLIDFDPLFSRRLPSSSRTSRSPHRRGSSQSPHRSSSRSPQRGNSRSPQRSQSPRKSSPNSARFYQTVGDGHGYPWGESNGSAGCKEGGRTTVPLRRPTRGAGAATSTTTAAAGVDAGSVDDAMQQDAQRVATAPIVVQPNSVASQYLQFLRNEQIHKAYLLVALVYAEKTKFFESAEPENTAVAAVIETETETETDHKTTTLLMDALKIGGVSSVVPPGPLSPEEELAERTRRHDIDFLLQAVGVLQRWVDLDAEAQWDLRKAFMESKLTTVDRGEFMSDGGGGEDTTAAEHRGGQSDMYYVEGFKQVGAARPDLDIIATLRLHCSSRDFFGGHGGHGDSVAAAASATSSSSGNGSSKKGHAHGHERGEGKSFIQSLRGTLQTGERVYGLKSALDEALRNETEDMTIAPVNQRMQNIIHRVQLSRGKGMGDGNGGLRGGGGGSEAYLSGSSAAVVAAANASAGYREIMEAVMQVSEKGGQAAAAASGAGGAALHAATTAAAAAAAKEALLREKLKQNTIAANALMHNKRDRIRREDLHKGADDGDDDGGANMDDGAWLGRSPMIKSREKSREAGHGGGGGGGGGGGVESGDGMFRFKDGRSILSAGQQRRIHRPAVRIATAANTSRKQHQGGNSNSPEPRAPAPDDVNEIEAIGGSLRLDSQSHWSYEGRFSADMLARIGSKLTQSHSYSRNTSSRVSAAGEKKFSLLRGNQVSATRAGAAAGAFGLGRSIDSELSGGSRDARKLAQRHESSRKPSAFIPSVLLLGDSGERDATGAKLAKVLEAIRRPAISRSSKASAVGTADSLVFDHRQDTRRSPALDLLALQSQTESLSLSMEHQQWRGSAASRGHEKGPENGPATPVTPPQRRPVEPPRASPPRGSHGPSPRLRMLAASGGAGSSVD